MKPEFEQKITKTVLDAKNFIANWEPVEVPMNVPGNTEQQIYDAFGKLTNDVCKLNYHKKNLRFLLTLLIEGRTGVSPNTPSGAAIVRQFERHEAIIKELLKGYTDAENAAHWQLKYYDKGGGLRYD